MPTSPMSCLKPNVFFAQNIGNLVKSLTRIMTRLHQTFQSIPWQYILPLPISKKFPCLGVNTNWHKVVHLIVIYLLSNNPITCKNIHFRMQCGSLFWAFWSSASTWPDEQPKCVFYIFTFLWGWAILNWSHKITFIEISQWWHNAWLIV